MEIVLYFPYSLHQYNKLSILKNLLYQNISIDKTQWFIKFLLQQDQQILNKAQDDDENKAQDDVKKKKK